MRLETSEKIHAHPLPPRHVEPIAVAPVIRCCRRDEVAGPGLRAIRTEAIHDAALRIAAARIAHDRFLSTLDAAQDPACPVAPPPVPGRRPYAVDPPGRPLPPPQRVEPPFAPRPAPLPLLTNPLGRLVDRTA